MLKIVMILLKQTNNQGLCVKAPHENSFYIFHLFGQHILILFCVPVRESLRHYNNIHISITALMIHTNISLLSVSDREMLVLAL